ncbi:SRPBCC family protein [Nocardioides acrostichi]|uniref:SRPBCC family protein n=1 Tax=Nocardioides acrostichi TaxID=2784339 RepID=A0A930Y5L4_9ACTN|nr:SRPBCC family protein [Nocardioides acrostichi]MBF4161360.1 SRPBCC family protein [Nocardioides acrostichi]
MSGDSGLGHGRTVGGTVHVGVSPEVAFDYLVDPAHRPAWQSSLASVTDIEGEPGLGQTWTDVTKPGLRPAMRTTAFDRPGLWAEDGVWKAVRASLELRFTPCAEGCAIGYRFRITGRGPLAFAGWAASFGALPAVRADLRRAARILEGRES